MGSGKKSSFLVVRPLRGGGGKDRAIKIRTYFEETVSDINELTLLKAVFL